MRNTVLLSLILLVSVAWAVAQQEPASPAGSSGQSPTQSTPHTAPGQATTPDSPQAAPTPEAAGSMIEGCLGGAAPNFTVTDKAGTTYKLDIPQGADTTPLTRHIGESVQVQGAVNNPASGSAASAGASAAAAQPTIAVARIGRGTGTCAAGKTGPKTPTK